METNALYQRKFESGTSTIWLYTDRIEISSTNTPQNTVVYFDEVIACGFLDMDIERPHRRMGSLSFYDEYKDNELVITYRSGREVITDRQCRELPVICAFINERLAAGNFPSRNVKLTRTAIDGEYSEMRFADDKTSYIACICAAVLLIVGAVGLLMMKLALLPISIFLLILSFTVCYMGYSFRSDYTEVQLYDDRIAIRDFKGNVISEICFNDIKSVGFLHGPIIYNNTIDGPRESGNYARPEALVIIQYSGPRTELSRDLSNLHQLAAIIEQKIS